LHKEVQEVQEGKDSFLEFLLNLLTLLVNLPSFTTSLGKPHLVRGTDPEGAIQEIVRKNRQDSGAASHGL
jgi:hypothetical protein